LVYTSLDVYIFDVIQAGPKLSVNDFSGFFFSSFGFSSNKEATLWEVDSSPIKLGQNRPKQTLNQIV
jgi:hypothetical protein